GQPPESGPIEQSQDSLGQEQDGQNQPDEHVQGNPPRAGTGLPGGIELEPAQLLQAVAPGQTAWPTGGGGCLWAWLGWWLGSLRQAQLRRGDRSSGLRFGCAILRHRRPPLRN